MNERLFPGNAISRLNDRKWAVTDYPAACNLILGDISLLTSSAFVRSSERESKAQKGRGVIHDRNRVTPMRSLKGQEDTKEAQ